jgi:hypothetical protein
VPCSVLNHQTTLPSHPIPSQSSLLYNSLSPSSVSLLRTYLPTYLSILSRFLLLLAGPGRPSGCPFTLPCRSSSYLTLPCLALPFLSFPFLTLPYLVYLATGQRCAQKPRKICSDVRRQTCVPQWNNDHERPSRRRLIVRHGIDDLRRVSNCGFGYFGSPFHLGHLFPVYIITNNPVIIP